MVARELPRQRNWLLPVLLILAGLLVFAANLGWLGWVTLFDVFRLWPLLLIAVGADLLLGGRYRFFIVLAALAIGALLYAGGPALGLPAGETVTVSQGLEGARDASIRLQVGVAELRVDSRADAEHLITGTVQTGQGERVAQTFRMEGSTAVYALTSEGRTSGFQFGGNGRLWDLSLTAGVPLALVRSSASACTSLWTAEVPTGRAPQPNKV